MPSSYTLNNGIELIGTGEQSGTWGDTTNTNLELLDAALDGQVTITAASAGSSGSPNSLPISDGSASNGRNRLVNITSGTNLGSTVYYQLTPNDAEKIIYIRNSLNTQDLIVFQGTYNSSNDYVIPNGTTAVIFFNGAGAGAVAANVFNNAHFDNLNIVGDVTIGDDLTLNSDGAIINIGADNDLQITHSGTAGTITNATGDLTLDVAGDIILDADGADFKFRDGGAGFFTISNSSLDAILKVEQSNEDFIIKGNDGGLEITALTLDMSEAGAATFNSGVTLSGDLTVDTDTLYVDSTNNRVNVGNGRSSATAASNADDLVVEASGDGGISILNPASNTGTLFFGDPSAGNAGQIKYSHSSDSMSIVTSQNTAIQIDSSQRVLIGYTANISVADHNAAIQVVGQGTADYHGATTSIIGFSNNSNGAYLNFASGRSNTAGTYTIVANDDTVGQINFAAADGTDMASRAAFINVNIDGAPSANDTPGRIIFSTTASGASSPTERMRINNSGDVTIGSAASARARLEVYDSGVSAVFNATDLSTWRVMQVRNNIESATGTAAGIAFGGDGSSDTETAGIVGISDNSTGGVVQLAFITATGNNSLEAMRIDSDQRVLIGDTSSQAVYEDDSAINSTLQINNSEGSAMIARTIGSGRLFLARNQSVVLNSPLGEVSFNGGDGTNLRQAAKIIASVDGGPATGDMPGRLQFYTTADGAATPTERMRITNDGKVLISSAGGGAPGAQLQVSYNDSSTTHSAQGQTPNGLRMYNTNTGVDVLTSISFAAPNAGTALASINMVNLNGFAASTTALGDLTFSTKASGSSTQTERMRVKSDGNVGVATGGTVPSRLAVVLNGNNDGNVNNWSSGMATFHIGGNTSTSQALAISGSTATSEMYITSLAPSTAWKGMAFRAANYKFLHEGASTTAPFLFMNNNGISFDGGSNFLDDYEEGNWASEFNIPSGSVTYNAGTGGVYTKIGRMVHVNAWMYIGTLSSPSGTLTLTLPFTNQGNFRASQVNVVNRWTGFTGQIGCWLSANSTSLNFVTLDNGTMGASSLNGTNMQTNCEMYINFSYETT